MQTPSTQTLMNAAVKALRWAAIAGALGMIALIAGVSWMALSFLTSTLPIFVLRSQDRAFVARVEEALKAPGDKVALHALIEDEGWREACIAGPYIPQEALDALAGQPVKGADARLLSGDGYWGLILKKDGAFDMLRVPRTVAFETGVGACFNLDLATLEYLGSEFNREGVRFTHIGITQESAE